MKTKIATRYAGDAGIDYINPSEANERDFPFACPTLASQELHETCAVGQIEEAVKFGNVTPNHVRDVLRAISLSAMKGNA